MLVGRSCFRGIGRDIREPARRHLEGLCRGRHVYAHSVQQQWLIRLGAAVTQLPLFSWFWSRHIRVRVRNEEVLGALDTQRARNLDSV